LKTISDVYQKISSIQNAVNDKQRGIVLKSVKEILAGLKHITVKLESVEKSFSEFGIESYSEKISIRCGHLFGKSKLIYETHLKTFSDNNLPIFKLDDNLENQLRDFYHYLYYTCYYSGRIVLVRGEQPDINEHKRISGALGEFCNNGEANQDLAATGLLAQILVNELTEKRETSDYKMNNKLIGELAIPDNICSDYERTLDLVEKCGVKV